MADFGQFSIPKIARVPPAAPGALRWEIWLLYLSIAIGVASLIVAGGLFGYRRVLGARHAQWVQNVRAEEEALRSPVVGEFTDLSGAIAGAREALAGHRFVTNVFRFLQEATHQKVQFTSFHFTEVGPNVELSGVAASYRTVAEQVSVLESRPEVSAVNFGGLSAGPQGRVSFRLSIAVAPALLRYRPNQAVSPLP